MRTILLIAVLSVFSSLFAGPHIHKIKGVVATVTEFPGDSLKVKESHFTIMENDSSPVACVIDPVGPIHFYLTKTFSLLTIPGVEVVIKGQFFGLEGVCTVKEIYFPKFDITLPPPDRFAYSK